MSSTARSGCSSFADSVTSSAVRGYHPSEMTDASYVERALRGDASAFAALVDRHAPACLRYATRMLGTREDAEDVTQDTLLRAYRALARYDHSLSFRTWIMSILVNRCRTALLHRKRRTSHVVLDEDAVDRAVSADGPDAALRDAIERALDRIDPAQREAFLLRYVEMMSYEEMSAATGAGVSALKMRVQRGCDRLRVLLEEDRYA
jgi:RNA polymerase sigma-70 factor, ECF subfamily